MGGLIIAKDFILANLNDDGVILPADIVGIDRNNTTNEKLVKLIRVLQSLDDDNNPDNGIFINDNVKGYLNQDINIIDANISTLETIVKNAKKIFKDPTKARKHYLKTLKGIVTKQNKSIDDVLSFVTLWQTNLADTDITIPTDFKYTYNYTVDWGDGEIQKNISNSITHTYSSIGNHIVKIRGVFPAIRMAIKKDVEKATNLEKINAKKLKKIIQWGNIKWSSFQNAFAHCSNLDVNATDTPDLSNTSSASHMFLKAYSLKGNRYFNDWDVSRITDMSAMFYVTTTFNQPLNSWDVSNVTNMSHMFGITKAFNQPLNDWNVSNVTNMHFMFVQAKAFNQPLNNWDVSNVTDMDWMFFRASAFTNQDLSSWNVSNVSSVKHDNFMTKTGGGNTEPKLFKKGPSAKKLYNLE